MSITSGVSVMGKSRDLNMAITNVSKNIPTIRSEDISIRSTVDRTPFNSSGPFVKLPSSGTNVPVGPYTGDNQIIRDASGNIIGNMPLVGPNAGKISYLPGRDPTISSGIRYDSDDDRRKLEHLQHQVMKPTGHWEHTVVGNRPYRSWKQDPYRPLSPINYSSGRKPRPI